MKKYRTILVEKIIKSLDGFIDEKKLDNLIKSTMKKYNINQKWFKDLKNDVIDDFNDSDISQVEEEDILQIYDASSYEYK